MTQGIPRLLARTVRDRAGSSCEYCRLPQLLQEATFHIDHILPLASEGATTEDNLALACVTCSLKKSARLLVLDPISSELVPIFNPRRQIWTDHFQLAPNWWLIGKTPIGRATIHALGMNRKAAVKIRRFLETLGQLPE